MYFLNQQSIKSFLESPNMVRGVLYLCATFSAGEAFPSNPRWFTSSSWLTVPFVLFFTSQDKLEAKRDDFCKQNMKASSDYCMALIQDIFCPLEHFLNQEVIIYLLRRWMSWRISTTRSPERGYRYTTYWSPFLGPRWSDSFKLQWEQQKCNGSMVPVAFIDNSPVYSIGQTAVRWIPDSSHGSASWKHRWEPSKTFAEFIQ